LRRQGQGGFPRTRGPGHGKRARADGSWEPGGRATIGGVLAVWKLDSCACSTGGERRWVQGGFLTGATTPNLLPFHLTAPCFPHPTLLPLPKRPSPLDRRRPVQKADRPGLFWRFFFRCLHFATLAFEHGPCPRLF